MATVLLVASAVVATSGVSAADAPIAVARDLGTGTGTESRSAALAGSVVVGRVDGADAARPLFQYDLADPAATIRVLNDGGFYSLLSSVADADGPYVAGNQQAGTASTRAFVFDVRTQGAVQVPRLGGLQAFATAIDRGVVVGASETGTSPSHAFAYDVDGAREVLDLGTLGGQQSTASDVSGALVVGQADGPDLAAHGFVVDLAAPGRPMTDLGTLGGAESAATAVAGDVVVGWAEVPGGARQAFAVRHSAPGPLTPLGTLGGPTSTATDVSGEVVVGTSSRADGSVGIWWTDLRTVPHVLHDLGTQADAARPPIVLEGVVVGTRRTAAGDRAFVADVAAGSVLELDPLPGHARTTAADVAGSTVAGTSYGAAGESSARATVWTVGTAPAPAFHLARPRSAVSEGRTARIAVVRTGDVRPAAEVRYRVTGTKRGATARADFRKSRGTVRFATGQARAFIVVRVVDDRVRERRERARVRISAMTAGTTVTAPRRVWLDVRASDRRREGGGS